MRKTNSNSPDLPLFQCSAALVRSVLGFKRLTPGPLVVQKPTLYYFLLHLSKLVVQRRKLFYLSVPNKSVVPGRTG